MTVLVQSTPLLLEVAPEIDTKSTSFYGRRGRRGVGPVKVRTEWGKFAASVAHPEAIRFSASGWLCPWPPDQGLCLWTPVGALPPDPGYRLALAMPGAQAPQTWYSGLTPASGARPLVLLSDGLDTRPCKILDPPVKSLIYRMEPKTQNRKKELKSRNGYAQKYR